MTPLLEVRNVSKSYGEAKALEDVSLEVSPGELVILVGPSGCGKSTLLSLVAGLDRPDAGAILVDGRPVQGPGPERSLVFQDGALFPWLSVRGNVEFGLRQAGVARRERGQRADEALARVGLDGFHARSVHELSGGQRQRVALARSLVLQPRLILMDESFSALDAPTREGLYDELQALQQETGATILFVTHNVREAVVLGDRVVLMAPHPGRVQETFQFDLPRPRHIDDVRVTRASQRIAHAMRGVPDPEEFAF